MGFDGGQNVMASAAIESASQAKSPKVFILGLPATSSVAQDSVASTRALNIRATGGADRPAAIE
jgi:hypothetical protein